jgi:hypothetical protein
MFFRQTTEGLRWDFEGHFLFREFNVNQYNIHSGGIHSELLKVTLRLRLNTPNFVAKCICRAMK